MTLAWDYAVQGGQIDPDWAKKVCQAMRTIPMSDHAKRSAFLNPVCGYLSLQIRTLRDDPENLRRLVIAVRQFLPDRNEFFLSKLDEELRDNLKIGGIQSNLDGVKKDVSLVIGLSDVLDLKRPAVREKIKWIYEDCMEASKKEGEHQDKIFWFTQAQYIQRAYPDIIPAENFDAKAPALVN